MAVESTGLVSIPQPPVENWLVDDPISLHSWMRPEYGMPFSLGSSTNLVYARIYEATKNGIGVFCESQGRLGELIGRSRRQVAECLRRLLNAGLIEVVGYVGHERTGIRAYRALPGPVNRAVAAWMSAKTADSAGNSTFVDGVGMLTLTASVDLKSPSPTACAGSPQVASAPELSTESPEDPSPLTPEREKSFRDLVDSYDRPPARADFMLAAKRSYARLLDEGYSPTEVREAADAYLADFYDPCKPRSRRNPRYLKYLNNWLADASGARAWLSVVRPRGRMASKCEQASTEAARPLFKSFEDRGRRVWFAEVGSEQVFLDVGDCPSREELERALAREREVDGGSH